MRWEGEEREWERREGDEEEEGRGHAQGLWFSRVGG